MEVRTKEFFAPRCEVCRKQTSWQCPRCFGHYCDRDCMEEDPLHTPTAACREHMPAAVWNGTWPGRNDGIPCFADIFGVDSDGTFVGMTDKSTAGQLPYHEDSPMFLLPGPLPEEKGHPVPASFYAKAEAPDGNSIFSYLLQHSNLVPQANIYYAIRLPELPCAWMRLGNTQQQWLGTTIEKAARDTIEKTRRKPKAK